MQAQRVVGRQTVPPVGQLLDLDELKTHCQVTASSELKLLDRRGRAAVRRCEHVMSRALLTQTWEFCYDRFPNRSWSGSSYGATYNWVHDPERQFRIPMPPLQSVTKLEYMSGGQLRLLDPSVYRVDAVSEPARIALAGSAEWPAADAVLNAIRITVVCGYASPELVPDEIVLAAQMLTRWMFDNRGETDAALPRAVEDLLMPYWVPGF